MYPLPPSFTPWAPARGGHRQTLFAYALKTGAPSLDQQAGFERFEVPLRADQRGGSGCFLEGWFRPGSGPAVLLLHGLGGSVDSGYMRIAAQVAARAGHAVLALNHRGSGEVEQTDVPYMAGRTEDLGDAMDWLRQRAGTERVVCVGFSLSGNTLLKLLGERNEAPPEFALAICCPVSLDHASGDLLQWPTHAYDLWMLRSCRRWVPQLRGSGSNPPRYHVPAFSSMRTFDERYITPVWGFASRADYYAQASSAAGLTEIQTPTVIVSAMDDPIVDGTRVAEAPRSPCVQHLPIASGGHLGFLASNPDGRGPRRWLGDLLDHYLALAREGPFQPSADCKAPLEGFALQS